MLLQSLSLEKSKIQLKFLYLPPKQYLVVSPQEVGFQEKIMKWVSKGAVLRTQLCFSYLASQFYLADKCIRSKLQSNSSRSCAFLLPAHSVFTYRSSFLFRVGCCQLSVHLLVNLSKISNRDISVSHIHFTVRVCNLSCISYLTIISSYIQEGICLGRDFYPFYGQENNICHS